MASLTNQNKIQVDLPVWEQLTFAPAVSSALSSSCAVSALANLKHGRYIYYLISATSFWKYDTYTDTYVQLSSPPIATSVYSSMQFSGSYGFEGRILSATNNTAVIPAHFGKVCRDYAIDIVSGTGIGQRRIITDVSNAIVADSGVPTTVSATVLTDTLKAWAINQYADYQLRITYGTGLGQVRRILSNTATTLTFADNTVYEYDDNCNPAPFSPALSTVAGSQSLYSIESSTITVNSNWDTNPDSTSKFSIDSGGIYLLSSAASTPFFTLQFYDILAGTWYIKTSTSAILSVVGTDGCLQSTPRNATLLEAGVATYGTTTSLTDSTQNWAVDSLVGKAIRFVSGTTPSSGADRIRRITANTATQIQWSGTVTTPIDSTTRYRVEGFDGGVASAATSTTLTDASASSSVWVTNRWANHQVTIVSGTGIGQKRVIASNTATQLTLLTGQPWTVTPDTTSGYIITADADKCYTIFGNQSNMAVYNINADMSCNGRLFDSGCAAQGTVTVSGRRPQAITTITFSTTTATVTTANSHRLVVGQSITISGATGGDAATYNITTTVVAVTSATVFTYTMGGTPAGNATFTGHSVTTLTDGSKAWTVNGWANYVCYFLTAQPVLATGAATCVAMEIASNTATTLTFKTATTAPTNGTSRYIIAERAALGSADHGIATGAGQTTTAIADSGKSWAVNIWAGKRVKTVSGAGQAEERIITSNTSTVLTISTVGTLPVAASTSYAILDAPIRSTGTALLWINGSSDGYNAGKYIWSPRGGGILGWDRYNIATNRWESVTTIPQIETLTTGSQYAYDGVDRLYFYKDATLRMYYVDTLTSEIHGAGFVPYSAPTGVISNRMEIFTTPDGLKYLWYNRASFTDMFRQLLFY